MEFPTSLIQEKCRSVWVVVKSIDQRRGPTILAGHCHPLSKDLGVSIHTRAIQKGFIIVFLTPLPRPDREALLSSYLCSIKLTSGTVPYISCHPSSFIFSLSGRLTYSGRPTPTRCDNSKFFFLFFKMIPFLLALSCLTNITKDCSHPTPIMNCNLHKILKLNYRKVRV